MEVEMMPDFEQPLLFVEMSARRDKARLYQYIDEKVTQACTILGTAAQDVIEAYLQANPPNLQSRGLWCRWVHDHAHGKTCLVEWLEVSAIDGSTGQTFGQAVHSLETGKVESVIVNNNFYY